MSRRKLLAILAAVAIVLAAFATWQIIRPRTIAEVLSMDHLPLGGAIALQGTITGIGREDTPYGPRVYLQLDGDSHCGGTLAWEANLLGDPNGSYEIGDSYSTTLHPQTFSINGRSAVWAPELACPFPAGFRSLGVVFDAVSETREMVLVYNGTDAAAWSRYDIRTGNATGFDPDRLPVVLLKTLPFPESRGPIDSARAWDDVQALFYVAASTQLGTDFPGSTGFSIADRMASLGAASESGMLRFVDADSDGIVGNDDRLEVRLPSTGSANAWDSYLVMIGNWSASAPRYGAAVHVILTGLLGPLDALPPVWTVALSARPADGLVL